MIEKLLPIQAILTTSVPEKPAFEDFLSALRSAGLSANIENELLTVEIANQNIESVRSLVKSLLGNEVTIDVVVDEEVRKMETPISELDLRYSLKKRILYSEKITTLRDLLSCNIHHWHVGNQGEREIRTMLYNMGIYVDTVHGSVLGIPNEDLDNGMRPPKWFSASGLNNKLPKGMFKNSKLLIEILEPLIEIFPDQVGWFTYKTARVFKIHPKLANTIIVTCSTRSDLEAFVQRCTEEKSNLA